MEMYIPAIGFLILLTLGILFLMTGKDSRYIKDGSSNLMPHMMQPYFPTYPDGLMPAKKVDLINKRHFSKSNKLSNHHAKFYQTPTALEISNAKKTLDKKPPIKIISAHDWISDASTGPVLKTPIIDFPAVDNFRNKEEMKASLISTPIKPPTAMN
jgi:hypothetical protein